MTGSKAFHTRSVVMSNLSEKSKLYLKSNNNNNSVVVEDNNTDIDDITPLFSFGVIADVQWADADDGYNYGRTVKRCYRGSFQTLENAVNWWELQQSQQTAPLTFIAQLGDLIDGLNHKLNQSERALNLALEQLDRAPCPCVNIVGNHELYNFNRKYLSSVNWLKHGDREYHSFSPSPGWKVVVLDPYQIALIGHDDDDPRRLEAVDIMGRENPNVHPNGKDGDWLVGVEGHQRRFVPYNGGFGKEQLDWFRSELQDAATANERVVVMSHVIIHPMACGGSTMAWDYEEALGIINSEECVVTVLCGHDHKGNYYFDEENGVHHCTFSSPLNKGTEGHAYGIICIHKDNTMEIRGPKIDDLLPDVQGRPAPEKLQNSNGESKLLEYESIRLRLKSSLLSSIKYAVSAL